MNRSPTPGVVDILALDIVPSVKSKTNAPIAVRDHRTLRLEA